jgi:hypothetical protein
MRSSLLLRVFLFVMLALPALQPSLPLRAKASPSPSGKPGAKSKGSGNHVIDEMQRRGVTITRRNYMLWAWGDPNYQPDAEQESMLPPEIRRVTPR